MHLSVIDIRARPFTALEPCTSVDHDAGRRNSRRSFLSISQPTTERPAYQQKLLLQYLPLALRRHPSKFYANVHLATLVFPVLALATHFLTNLGPPDPWL